MSMVVFSMAGELNVKNVASIPVLLKPFLFTL